MNHLGDITLSCIKASMYVDDLFEFLGKQLYVVDKRDLFVDE
jgi:hypothetical protein